MGKDATTDAAPHQVIEAAARGELTEQRIQQLVEHDPQLVALALVAAQQAIDQLRGRQAPAPAPPEQSASTPSGQRPIYTKPNRRKKGGGKKRGAKQGHQGHRRPSPEHIDQYQTHPPLKACPCCGEAVSEPRKHRRRLIIDLPPDLSTQTTEHTIPRQWCAQCRKDVEPTVPDAMPKATFGHQMVATTAWFHYGLGVTIDQIVQIIGSHLNTRLTAGGLVAMWVRLAALLEPWYEQIAEQARSSSHLHVDETGWRVDGATHWLWCFANPRVCYYIIDPSRGSPVLARFFADNRFDGVLITDFWAAYGAVLAADHQYCLAHLLRELEAVDARNDSAEWGVFSKKLKRLIRDGIRLWMSKQELGGRYRKRVAQIDKRLDALAEMTYADSDARRLAERLDRYRPWLFTFLDYEHVPWENNFAERQIRPAVILRKNSQSNRSDRGAAVQAVLMSVFQTLKLRGLDPTETIARALRQYLQEGELPPLPDQPAAHG